MALWNSANSLQAWGSGLLWIAAIAGGISVVTSFVSSVFSNRATDIVQRDADTRIASANALSAAAGLETMRLREKMAWRRVTAEQTQTLKDDLAGQEFEVWTSFVGSDPETTIFRNEIDSALKQSGLRTKYYSGWEVALGLKVLGPESEEKAKLISALKRANFAFTVEGPGSFSPSDLVIIVGTKPEPQ
jgi:hypothetical protein